MVELVTQAQLVADVQAKRRDAEGYSRPTKGTHDTVVFPSEVQQIRHGSILLLAVMRPEPGSIREHLPTS